LLTAPAFVLVLEPVLYVLGAALLVAAVHAWRRELPIRAGLAYAALVAAFFAVPLFTGALQVPTDLAYRWLPWRDAVRDQPRTPVANPLLVDVVAEQMPFHGLVRDRLLRLEAPLWANEMGAGQPLLANAQSAPFAPLHLMALPLPTARALTVSVAWEILLALLLMHALLLRLGAGGTGAAFGAVAAGLSTYLVAWAYHPLAMAAVWIPGLLLGLLLLRWDEPRSFPGLVVCGLGLASSGQPETMGYAALAAAGVAVVLACHRSPGRGRFLRRLLAAGALTACLAAPLLLPVLEQLPWSQRAGSNRSFGDTMQPLPFAPQALLPLVDPLAFGSPRDRNWSLEGTNFNELCSDYAGLVTLAVALAGALVFRGRIAAVLLCGLASLLAALRIPPFYDAVRALPLVGEGATARLRLFWILAVAVAAALSVGRLAEDRRGRIAGAIALLAAAGALAVLPPPGGAPWQTAWWIAALAGTAGALAALLIPPLRRRFALVALAAVLLDLFVLEVRYQPVPAPGRDLSPPPALAFLIEQARSTPASGPFRVLGEGYDLLPNLAALFGLWDPRPQDPMHPFGSARFVRRRLLSEDPELRHGAESFLAVRYKLVKHRQSLPPPWRPVFNDVGGRVWENPDALPLFFLPRRFQWGDEDGVLAAMLSWRGVKDFRELGVAQGKPGPAGDQEGVVQAIRAGTGRFDLVVDSATGGVVVSSVSYSPGWMAEIDGRRSPMLEVDSGFLGFHTPPGRHAVHLLYRPAGWTLGLALCGLGAIAALAGSLLDRRRQTAERTQ
jgi:hypothetical protein